MLYPVWISHMNGLLRGARAAFCKGLMLPTVVLTCLWRLQEDEVAYALKCNISLEVNHLGEGIKLALKDDREKNSEQLGRTVLFEGSSAITSLPPYLTVQMVRFYYKADVQQKAKILRKVRCTTVVLIRDAWQAYLE